MYSLIPPARPCPFGFVYTPSRVTTFLFRPRNIEGIVRIPFARISTRQRALPVSRFITPNAVHYDNSLSASQYIPLVIAPIKSHRAYILIKALTSMISILIKMLLTARCSRCISKARKETVAWWNVSRLPSIGAFSRAWALGHGFAFEIVRQHYNYITVIIESARCKKSAAHLIARLQRKYTRSTKLRERQNSISSFESRNGRQLNSPSLPLCQSPDAPPLVIHYGN